MTITLGWWLLPTVITIAAFVWAFSDNEAGDIIGALLLLAAVVVSLFAWVVYLGIGWALS